MKSIKENAVYFKSLTLENIKCFRESQTIDLTNNDGKPAQWTVILGNNNTGKTTLLKVLGDFSIKHPTVYNEKKNEQLFLNTLNLGWFEELYLEDIKNNFFVKLILQKKESQTPICTFVLDEKMTIDAIRKDFINEAFIYAYGTNRKSSNKTDLSEKNNFTNNLYDNNAELINAQEWLKEIYLASKSVKKAANRLEKIKAVLIKISPDIQGFRFVTDEETFATHVEVQTDFGWIKINDLGYGYQSLMAWIIDLAKKMFDRYPDSENPLQEPAIVLVDEIDLHLHPEWQRKIIGYLSENFPRTQFIVTAHSPLIVQSADEINVVLLKKVGDKVVIEQPKVENFQGWKVEEILSDLMDLDERVYSDAFLKLRKQFDEALQENNYEKAKAAKAELEKILSPDNMQRKILEIQMTSLTPELTNH